MAELTTDDGSPASWEAIAKFEQERREKAERSQEFTEQWYAERIERLTQFAKDRDVWPEVACILANGTLGAEGSPVYYEPPTYAQQLNGAKHRATKAESQLQALQQSVQGEIERLRDFDRTNGKAVAERLAAILGGDGQ